MPPTTPAVVNMARRLSQKYRRTESKTMLSCVRRAKCRRRRVRSQACLFGFATSELCLDIQRPALGLLQSTEVQRARATEIGRKEESSPERHVESHLCHRLELPSFLDIVSQWALGACVLVICLLGSLVLARELLLAWLCHPVPLVLLQQARSLEASIALLLILGSASPRLGEIPQIL